MAFFFFFFWSQGTGNPAGKKREINPAQLISFVCWVGWWVGSFVCFIRSFGRLAVCSFVRSFIRSLVWCVFELVSCLFFVSNRKCVIWFDLKSGGGGGGAQVHRALPGGGTD